MHTRLDPETFEAALARIERSQREARPPLLRDIPVSTLRIEAQRFRHDSLHRAGARALRLLQSYAPDSIVLAKALRLPGFEALPTDPAKVDLLLERLDSGATDLHPTAFLAHDVYRRVLRRLQSTPAQDLRVDFSDLTRVSEEEHRTLTLTAATELTLAAREGMLPELVGIALPALRGPSARRALRTLDLFLSTIIDRSGTLPEPFLVSLTDVTHEDQVSTMAHVCGTLEGRMSLPRGTLRFEIVISQPQAMFEESGVARLPTIVGAAAGRCSAVRVDAISVARALSSRDPAASIPTRELARVALAGSGIPLSWGTSPDLPRTHGLRSPADDPHRFGAVHAAWRTHAETVSRALKDGCFWGWDLDAGQLPARLAAVSVHFRQILPVLRQELMIAVASGEGMALEEARIGLACGALSLEDLSGTGIESLV